MEFPRGIGKPASRGLAAHGYTRIDHLTKVTTEDLLAIHGVGPKAIRILQEELARRGLSFATASSSKPATGNATSADRN